MAHLPVAFYAFLCACVWCHVTQTAPAEVAVLVMKALIESAAIDPQAMAHVAAEQSQGLRQAPGQVPLSPEEALEW